MVILCSYVLYGTHMHAHCTHIHVRMHAHSTHILCMACEVFGKGVNAYVTCMVGTYTLTCVWMYCTHVCNV